MHELGIVRRLLDQVREIQASHGGGIVRDIRIQVGPLSGVEAELMQSAFAQLCDAAGLSTATLTVDKVPLEARCPTCQIPFRPLRWRFRCPACGASDTEITQGDEILLESVALVDVSSGVIG